MKLVIVVLAFLIASPSWAAVYPLKVLVPRAVGTAPDAGQPTITSGHRIFWAYPGIDYTFVASVIGGAYPYTYSLPSGAPTGMTINSSTGIVTWTGANVSGGPYTVTFRVVDDEGTQVETTWEVTVDSTKFLFLSGSGVNRDGNGCSSSCGTGTLANPWRDISDWYGGDQYEDKTENDYVGKFIYYRTGTYPIDGYVENSWRMPVLGEYKPVVHMAYPGESPLIEQTTGATFAGGAWSFYGQNNNVYMDGLTFQSSTNPTTHNAISYPSGSYQMFTRNTWGDIISAETSLNQACLLIGSAQDSNVSAYMTVRLNTCDGVDLGAGLKFYSLRNAVIADNTITNVVDTTFGNQIEGIALKFGMDRVDVRANTVSSVTQKAIGGNMNSGSVLTRDMEIRYNRLYGCTTSCLDVNQNGAAGVIHVYRNTAVGPVWVGNTDAADGPFYFSNNVWETSGALDGCKTGSRIQCYSVSDPTRIQIAASPNDDLDCSAADDCVDADGNLQGAYLSYLGTHGFEISGSPDPPPSAPTGLTVVDYPGDVNGGQLNLAWTVSTSGDVTAQRIYRSTTSGTGYSLVQTYNNNTTAAHTDTGLNNGTLYYYVLRAYDGTSESANSNEGSATPIANPISPNSIAGPTKGGVFR